MRVHELGHVVLYVRDLERSRRFYDALGFDTAHLDRRGFAAYTSGRTHHELLLIQVGEDAEAIPEGKRVGLYHIGFKVGTTDDELREARAAVEPAGGRLVGSSDHGVTHSLYILDPDGNEIELYIDVQPERWREDPTLLMAQVKPLQL